MMKLPAKLKICGITYDVVYSTYETMDNEIAEIFATKPLIRIAKDATKELQELALMHEIFHAINEKLSEENVEFLAQAIYQVLKDNKLKF